MENTEDNRNKEIVTASESEIDEYIRMVERKMQSGVSRLRVSFSKEQEEGTVTEQYHHGRCDVGSPWARGTVSNCDQIDTL